MKAAQPKQQAKTILIKHESVNEFFKNHLNDCKSDNKEDYYHRKDVNFNLLSNLIHIKKTDLFCVNDVVIFELKDRGRYTDIDLIVTYNYQVFDYDDFTYELVISAKTCGGHADFDYEGKEVK